MRHLRYGTSCKGTTGQRREETGEAIPAQPAQACGYASSKGAHARTHAHLHTHRPRPRRRHRHTQERKTARPRDRAQARAHVARRTKATKPDIAHPNSVYRVQSRAQNVKPRRSRVRSKCVVRSSSQQAVRFEVGNANLLEPRAMATKVPEYAPRRNPSGVSAKAARRHKPGACGRWWNATSEPRFFRARTGSVHPPPASAAAARPARPRRASSMPKSCFWRAGVAHVDGPLGRQLARLCTNLKET